MKHRYVIIDDYGRSLAYFDDPDDTVDEALDIMDLGHHILISDLQESKLLVGWRCSCGLRGLVDFDRLAFERVGTLHGKISNELKHHIVTTLGYDD